MKKKQQLLTITKLFFPLALVFCQRSPAFSDGGWSSEQYQRHKRIDDNLNQIFERFKPTLCRVLPRPKKLATITQSKINTNTAPMIAATGLSTATSWNHSQALWSVKRIMTTRKNHFFFSGNR
jgi:hypothetical protein